MKNKSLLRNSLAALLPISLGIGVLLGAAKKPVAEKVEGYSASSLPTTIDLNDTSAANIRSYYSSLNNLSQSERQGTNLLKNLKTILKNGQKYYSYENGTSIWQMYEITDRDWDKSPASSTTYGTYNSSTNKITNYTYGTSSSSSKNNPYIHALYINRDVNNQTTAWDNHNQDQWGINREHVWPKAEGFDSSGAGGARGDPMHLMAGNGYANNIHSNYYYGYVKTSSSYTDCGSKYSNQSGNLRGTSKTLNSGTVFEPQDCDKGDIARAIFYMVARYNYLSGSDSDGIDTNNPNLTLTQDISQWSSSGYTSSTSTQGKLGVLTDLLAWHHADPVDEYEIHRNNLLYTNFTNNRNPFIDFPEWADFIWGTATYNGTTYQSYSSTPTGYATPSSDTINGYNSGGSSDPVSVTGVSLNVNSTSITVGNSEVLSATVLPNNATNQAVSWTSSNSSVATVSSSGRVEGVAEGNATITVTTSDGGYTATCAVTITASGGGGGGSGDPETDVMCAKGFGGYTTSSYSAAGTDYTGVANLTNSSGATYAMQVFNGSTGQVRGNQSTASANFSCRNTTTYTDYYISEVSLTVDSGGTLDGSTSGRSVVWFGSSAYANPTTAPSSGTQVAASPASSGQSTLTWTNSNTDYNYFILYNLKAASAPKSKDADTPLTVTWSPVSSSSEKALDSITLDTSDAPTTFNVGDTFSYEGLSVTANYDDGSDDIVTPTNVSTPDLSSAGQKTVTVSYTEGGVTKTATYTVTVNAVTLTSIEVSDAKTAYYVGDTFVKPTVTATFSNGSTSDVTNSATFSGYNLSSAGNQTVTVSYTNGTTQTTTYSITVTALAVTSIAVSGQTTSFKVGDSFSFGGTVTATYNNGSTSDATASATFSGYNMSTAGNQTVTVSFGGQSTTYQISVTESSGATDSTQYSLINSTGDLEAGKSYILTNGTSGTVKAAAVTSNSNNRKTTEVTISDSKITRGSSVLSFTLGGTSGAYTFETENYAGTNGYLASAAAGATGSANYLRVISSAGTATISFSGDQAVINLGPHESRTLIRFNSTGDSGNGIFACYSTGQSAVYLWKEVTPKVLNSISIDTTNVQTTFTVGSTFNYTGLVVTANYTDSTSATVSPTSVSTPDLSSTGSKSVTVTYEENGVSKTASYQVTVNATPSISWTAPTIDVYTGSTLSGSDVNGWAVTYNDGAGHQTVLTYSQITVKLGGTTISIPHTWVAADDGKTLTATYNDLTTTASSAIRVTQSVNSITVAVKENYDYTFESKQFSAAGSLELGGKSWTMSGTDDGSPFFGYDSTKGQQFGSGTHPFSAVTLQSSAFSGTVESVTVYTSGANSINATVQVSVGGTAYGSAETITNTNAAYTFDLGGKSGTISIDYVNSSSKAIYIKEIVVNTVGEASNIANSLDHIAAQRVAVKFAKAFNAAMDTTSNCTTNMSSAWSTCSSAYDTFLSEAAALGSTEEAYAKNLIKYATKQYSDDSGEACIERMLKTYEVCVQKHGQTAFMSDLVTLGSPQVNLLLVNITNNSRTISLIVIISIISVGAIGGYFFIRTRKKEEF